MNRAPRVYLYFGGDEYLVTETARKLVSTLVPEAEAALRLEIIEGKFENAAHSEVIFDQCLMALTTMGLLGGLKVVWLRNASFFNADAPGMRSDAAKKRLKQLVGLVVKDLPEGHLLLVTATDVDKRSAFYKACQEYGQVGEYHLQERVRDAERSALDRVSAELEAADLEANTGIKVMLRDRVGLDTRQIANEVGKLALYMGNRRQVEEGDIQAISSPTPSAVAWDLADALGTRDAAKAVNSLRQLLFQKEDPIGLMIVLESRLKELLFIREALDKGWVRLNNKVAVWGQLPDEVDRVLSEDLARDPRQTHPFRTGILIQQASRFNAAELLSAQRLMLTAHERLVTTTVPAPNVLELLLMRIVA